ncbi:hypothetical protein DRF65_05640 [Chryseobacterium pennae]|uniref:Uncharacterized protein n=1 Tax=Chryseobacterium pennae TaxID=2258962 RepID=A0A3D9CCX1_9FLAO|nr:hypothetical protein [Chryseobacterium pennae]REC63574.1 hypothetical protein DRF65_05640 [Chryseobacterium pennae]
MDITISYENEYFEPVTEKEALLSHEFVKIVKINGQTKIREEYVGNTIVEVTYYQEAETIADILDLYPPPIGVDIIHRKEIHGNYLREEIVTYNDHVSGLRAFSIVHHATEQCICFGSYDSETGEVKKDRVVKTKYDASGDIAYMYYYDASGKVYVIEEGDGGIFSGEFPESYYNYASPLFPEIKDNHEL